MAEHGAESEERGDGGGETELEVCEGEEGEGEGGEDGGEGGEGKGKKDGS